MVTAHRGIGASAGDGHRRSARGPRPHVEPSRWGRRPYADRPRMGQAHRERLSHHLLHPGGGRRPERPLGRAHSRAPAGRQRHVVEPYRPDRRHAQVLPHQGHQQPGRQPLVRRIRGHHQGAGQGRAPHQPPRRGGRRQRHRPLLGRAGGRRRLPHPLLRSAMVRRRHVRLAQRRPHHRCRDPHLQEHRHDLRHDALLPRRRPQRRHPRRLVRPARVRHDPRRRAGPAQPHGARHRCQHHRPDLDRARRQRLGHHPLRTAALSRRRRRQLDIVDQPRRERHLLQRRRPEPGHGAALPHPRGERRHTRRRLLVHDAQRHHAPSRARRAHAACRGQRPERHRSVMGPSHQRRWRGHKQLRDCTGRPTAPKTATGG